MTYKGSIFLDDGPQDKLCMSVLSSEGQCSPDANPFAPLPVKQAQHKAKDKRKRKLAKAATAEESTVCNDETYERHKRLTCFHSSERRSSTACHIVHRAKTRHTYICECFARLCAPSATGPTLLIMPSLLCSHDGIPPQCVASFSLHSDRRRRDP